MNILYLDCGMGAAGDMLTAALLELFEEPEQILETLNSLGLPGVTYKREACVRNGICGSQIRVLIDGDEENEGMHEHAHSHGHVHADLDSIERLIGGLAIPADVKQDVLSVFRLIAEAESRVHGRPITQIHFHEVGTIDAIADVTAVCMLMHAVAPDAIMASPVHVGHGQVRCSHGMLPVPAPATAEILKGIPVYGGRIEGELCTPTGAALLRHFVCRFGDMPAISIEKIGYGMGKKEFEQANCLRAFIGKSADREDEVCILSCNIDDMSAEEIGFAEERLLAAGARDVYTVGIGMKKNRPGTMLCVICDIPESGRFAGEIFRHTSTLGIRRETVGRYVLERSESVRETKYGSVRMKRSKGFGVVREKPEYDDLARIAVKEGKSIRQVRDELKTEE